MGPGEPGETIWEGRAGIDVRARPHRDGLIVTVTLCNRGELDPRIPPRLRTRDRVNRSLFEARIECAIESGELVEYPRVDPSLNDRCPRSNARMRRDASQRSTRGRVVPVGESGDVRPDAPGRSCRRQGDRARRPPLASLSVGFPAHGHGVRGPRRRRFSRCAGSHLVSYRRRQDGGISGSDRVPDRLAPPEVSGLGWRDHGLHALHAAPADPAEVRTCGADGVRPGADSQAKSRTAGGSAGRHRHLGRGRDQPQRIRPGQGARGGDPGRQARSAERSTTC